MRGSLGFLFVSLLVMALVLLVLFAWLFYAVTVYRDTSLLPVMVPISTLLGGLMGAMTQLAVRGNGSKDAIREVKEEIKKLHEDLSEHRQEMEGGGASRDAPSPNDMLW